MFMGKFFKLDNGVDFKAISRPLIAFLLMFFCCFGVILPLVYNYCSLNNIDFAYRILRTESGQQWNIAIPARKSCTFNETTAIRNMLDNTRYNWYWRVLSDEAKEEVLKRMQVLIRLPEFLNKKYPNLEIKSVIVKRAFVWGYSMKNRLGFLPDHPYDLDITIIVKGNEVISDNYKLTDNEVRQLFGHAERYTTRMDMKILGEEFLTDYFSRYDTVSYDTTGGFQAELRAISDRGSGITIAGPMWFQEDPPDQVWLDAFESSLDEARNLIEYFLEIGGEHYFSEEVQARYQYLAGLESSQLNIGEERELRALSEAMGNVGAIYGKAINRLLEGALRVRYFVTKVHTSLAAQISTIQSPDNIFACPEAVNTVNRIITEGFTEEFYHEMFSQDGIIQFLVALDALDERVEVIKSYFPF